MSGAGTPSRNVKSEPPFLTSSNNGCAAVILAGGEGVRLSSFTRELYGHHLPKQFCPLFGGKTLLEETMRRVSLFVPPSQTITVLNRAHKRFFSPLLNATDYRNLLIQPENRGTAPAILCALLRLVETGHTGPVAIFPSDHYVSDDFVFMHHVATAFRAVQRTPALTVLLGIAPDSPEAEYGWIEPGAPIEVPTALLGLTGVGEVRRICRFLEKPPAAVARELYDRHYLWNSFVLVGNSDTLLSLIAKALPELYSTFDGIRPFFGGAVEGEILQTVFRQLPSVDFSDRVLAEFPSEFSVLPVNGVTWSDLGDPKRLVAAISSSGHFTLGGNQIVPGNQSFPLTTSTEPAGHGKALQAHS
jgi:mannose-1-phosphate guanylyltransferase